MKRRVAFAAPFVVTLACGGSQRDPNEVTDPAPMRDIAQPSSELAPDASGLDDANAAPLETSLDEAVPPPVQEAPLCYVVANPPGYRSCPEYNVLKVEPDGPRLRFVFGGGTKQRLRAGMTVVLGKGMPAGTIVRCEMATCTATIELERERLPPVVFVITEKAGAR